MKVKQNKIGPCNICKSDPNAIHLNFYSVVRQLHLNTIDRKQKEKKTTKINSDIRISVQGWESLIYF